MERGSQGTCTSGIDHRILDMYLCECSDGRCTEPISLTRRSTNPSGPCPSGSRSRLNNENPEIDRVLFENTRFATVEKFYGAGAKIARATDHVDSGRRGSVARAIFAPAP